MASSNNPQGGPTHATKSFFSRFGRFEYDPIVGLQANFNRLSLEQNWKAKSKTKFWAECQETEFNRLFGTDVSKLEKWQELCRTVHIPDPPNSIRGCKKALARRDVLVNLCNLIDHYDRGVEVIRFKSYSAFLNYTKKRTFPLKRAKEDGFIKALLRRVYS